MKRSLPEEIVKFQDISNLYDVYFVDLWGVIHNGINLFDNAIYVLKKLKEKEKKIVVPKIFENDIINFEITDSTNFKLNKLGINEPVDGTSSICGVKVVLFLPLIIFDMTVASLPTTAFLASISYQLDDN